MFEEQELGQDSIWKTEQAVESGFRLYCREAAQEPLLTAEEEIALARVIRAGGGDAKPAAERFARANLRLVIDFVQEKFPKYAENAKAELVQMGNMGLLRAVAGFDPEKGNRFSTYAIPWIKKMVYAEYRRRQGEANELLLDRPLGEDGNTAWIDMIEDTEAAQRYTALERWQEDRETILVCLTQLEREIERARGQYAHLAEDEKRVMRYRLLAGQQGVMRFLDEELAQGQMDEMYAPLQKRWADMQAGMAPLERAQTLEELEKTLGLHIDAIRHTQERALRRLREPAGVMSVEQLMGRAHGTDARTEEQ